MSSQLLLLLLDQLRMAEDTAGTARTEWYRSKTGHLLSCGPIGRTGKNNNWLYKAVKVSWFSHMQGSKKTKVIPVDWNKEFFLPGEYCFILFCSLGKDTGKSIVTKSKDNHSPLRLVSKVSYAAVSDKENLSVTCPNGKLELKLFFKPRNTIVIKIQNINRHTFTPGVERVVGPYKSSLWSFCPLYTSNYLTRTCAIGQQAFPIF